MRSPMNERQKVDLHDLVAFFREGQHRLELLEQPDNAFILEMLGDFFEKDYKPSNKLIFTGGAIGL